MRQSSILASLTLAPMLWVAPVHGIDSMGGVPVPVQGTQAQPPSEAAVKQYITRKEQALATGVGSAHKAVTVTFESVRFGQSRQPTERDRVVNGITGKTVYPVRVRYTSLRRWGNGETETKVIHYAYEFYQDEYGEWSAYHVGPVT